MRPSIGQIVKSVASEVGKRFDKSEVMGEVRRRIAAVSADTGYAIPGSRKKAMKGVRATANSPNTDIIEKLAGMRGLSRDMAMNSPLAVAILERHKTEKINSGLRFQSRVDSEYLGWTEEQANAFKYSLEREFDLWSDSFCSDYDHLNCYGDNQALGYLNMMLSGDFWFIPTFEAPLEAGFPYETSIKLIDADLVRNPTRMSAKDKIQGGVELDSRNRPLGVHVWDTYENDFKYGGKGESRFVPFMTSEGRQQIFHVADFQRIKQSRGVPLLAPVAEQLKQMTRLGESELMTALVSSFFTAFVRDMSGMGDMIPDARPPEETITEDVSGNYGAGVSGDGDLAMGYGNIVYLDDSKDITIAEPRKTDRDFAGFWNSLATTVTAGANIPIGTALMKHDESYTAARAALINDWKYTTRIRSLINRKMNFPVLLAVASEAVIKNRIKAPGFLDSYDKRRAYLRGIWIGIGEGSLDPLRESKADAIKLNNHTDTHEDIYVSNRGERWEAAMKRKAAEEQLLEKLGLVNKPDPTELVGPDGQEDPEDDTP